MARKFLTGLDLVGKRLMNLGAATADTDAVTLAQLNAAIAQVSGGSPYVFGGNDANISRPAGPGPYIFLMVAGVTPVNATSVDFIQTVTAADATPAGPTGTTNDWRGSAFGSIADGTEYASWPAAVGGVPFDAGSATGIKPTITTIAGKKHILFDGTDDYLKALVGQVPQPFSWIVVGRQIGDVAARTASRVILATASTVSPYRAALIQPGGNTSLRSYAGSNGTWSDTTPTGTTNDVVITADNDGHMFGARFDGTSSVGIRDGLRVPVASGSTYVLDPGTEGYDGLILGANASLSAFSNFAVQRVIVGTFSAADIAAWRASSAVANFYGW